MSATTAHRALRLVPTTRRALWFLVSALLVVGWVASPWVVGTAAAQEGCADPGSDCAGSQADLNNILDALFTILYDALKYVAFAAIVLGGILYVTANRSTSRAQTGVGMFWGGVGLAILYFGFGSVMAALEWIASGGG